MTEFSHVDQDGKASMVDVSDKVPQKRTARASGSISLSPETIELIRENKIKKGDVITVSRIAGIQAAKQTATLIPLCHPLALKHIDVQLVTNETTIDATSKLVCIGRTGVEMEALTAVSVALLTIYDMCKAVDKQMEISNIILKDKVKEDV